MDYKIITCLCYDEIIMQREPNMIKRINHFHCNCNVAHKIFVCTFGEDVLLKCFCKICSHFVDDCKNINVQLKNKP